MCDYNNDINTNLYNEPFSYNRWRISGNLIPSKKSSDFVMLPKNFVKAPTQTTASEVSSAASESCHPTRFQLYADWHTEVVTLYSRVTRDEHFALVNLTVALHAWLMAIWLCTGGQMDVSVDDCLYLYSESIRFYFLQLCQSALLNLTNGLPMVCPDRRVEQPGVENLAKKQLRMRSIKASC